MDRIGFPGERKVYIIRFQWRVGFVELVTLDFACLIDIFDATYYNASSLRLRDAEPKSDKILTFCLTTMGRVMAADGMGDTKYECRMARTWR